MTVIDIGTETFTENNDWTNLQDMLSKHLKKPGKYIFFNNYTTKLSVPVIYKPKKEKALLITKTTHFCLLFSPQKVPLLAIEVYTYCTFYKDRVERLVYVSKADTTGLQKLGEVNVGQFIVEYMKWVCQIPVETLISNLKFKNDNSNQPKLIENLTKDKIFLSETHYALYRLEKIASGEVNVQMNKSSNTIPYLEYLELLGIDRINLKTENVKTKLVLFTRSEGQYLFPESIKNKGKHILDGRELLKWWLKNVDKITKNWSQCNRFLNILNSEEREIIRYFPSFEWKVGSVYDDPLLTSSASPAIYQIPLLPDDPKGRFLEHLIVEGRVKKVKCKQYWQELAIRQEFSFGAIVGLIGVSGIVNEFQSKNLQSTYLKPKIMKHVTELITSKDYFDKSDWSSLYDELSNIKDMKHFDIIGSWEGKNVGTKRTLDETDTKPVIINTLMCVKSRKKSKQ